LFYCFCIDEILENETKKQTIKKACKTLKVFIKTFDLLVLLTTYIGPWLYFIGTSLTFWGLPTARVEPTKVLLMVRFKSQKSTSVFTRIPRQVTFAIGAFLVIKYAKDV